jgi:hypothetical protein
MFSTMDLLSAVVASTIFWGLLSGETSPAGAGPGPAEEAREA